MSSLFNFLFKGEIPTSLTMTSKEDKEITLEANNSEIVEINELELNDKAEIKLRSFIIKLFSISIIILLFIIVAAMITFAVLDISMPKQLEWALSVVIGCIVGSVVTYMGVKQAEPTIVKAE